MPTLSTSPKKVRWYQLRGHVVVMLFANGIVLGAIGRSPEPWDAPYNRSYEPVERRAAEIYATYEFEPPHLKPLGTWAATA